MEKFLRLFYQQEGQGNIGYDDVPTVAPSPPLTAADDGLSIDAAAPTTVRLGQLVGALGNPAKLLQSREIPFNTFALILSELTQGGAQLILRDSATPGLLQQLSIQDSAGVAIVGIYGDPNASHTSFYITDKPPAALVPGAIRNTVVGIGALAQNVDGTRNNIFGLGAAQGQLHLNNCCVIGNDSLDTGGSSEPQFCTILGNNNLDNGQAVGNAVICIGGANNNSSGAAVGDHGIIIGNSIAVAGAARNFIIMIPSGNGADALSLSNVAVIADQTINTLVGQNYVTGYTDDGNRLQVNGNITFDGIRSSIRSTVLLAETFGTLDFTVLMDTTAGNAVINIDPTKKQFGNIKKISTDANTITITMLSGNIIDIPPGATTFVFSAPGTSIQFQTDGINAFVL